MGLLELSGMLGPVMGHQVIEVYSYYRSSVNSVISNRFPITLTILTKLSEFQELFLVHLDENR